MALGILLGSGATLNYTVISHPDGTDRTHATKINNNGEVVGYYTHTDGTIRGFYLENGAYVDVFEPSGDDTEVFGVNDQGQLVGMTFVPHGPPSGGFSWTGGTFSPITIPGADLVVGQDVNDLGQIVGVYNVGFDGFGYVMIGGVATDVVPDGALSSVLFGINDVGQMVGTAQLDPDTSSAFVYDGTVYTLFNAPGGAVTLAQDINDWGHIAGFYIDNSSDQHGFVYIDGNFYDIPVPTGVGAIPGSIQVTGINNLGQIVGSYVAFDSGGPSEHSFTATLSMAFTYDVTFFDHPDAEASFGTEIRNSNVDGDFVGRYSSTPGEDFTGQSFVSIGGVVSDLTFVEASLGVDARDINDLDQIVGRYLDESGFHGFVYDGGTVVTLDNALGLAGSTNVLGMNNIGQVVGTYVAAGGVWHAYVWDAATGFTELDISGSGAAGSNPIIALDINDFGQIVGTWVDTLGDADPKNDVFHGFSLNNGIFSEVAYAGAAERGTGAVSVNNAGQIAGFYVNSGHEFHTIVRSGGIYSVVDTTLPGGAYGISNSGVVSGSVNDSGVTYHGFLAEISGATFIPPVGGGGPDVVAWAKGVDGNFDDATKWAGGEVPGETDRVVINRAGEFTVTMTSNQTVDTLVIGSLDNDGAELHVVGATLQVNGGKIIVPGTLSLDANASDGAALLIDANTVIIGGCGCSPDIQLGLDGTLVAPNVIGTTGVAAKLVNTAYIAGQGQIGDSNMTLVNFGLIESEEGTLVLDTGSQTIVNGFFGLIEATTDSDLEVTSAINNFGIVAAEVDGRVELNGTVKNFASIEVDEGGSVVVNAALKNFGFIDADGTFLASSGGLNGDGAEINSYGTGLVDITGLLINQGAVTAFEDSEIHLDTVNNALGTLTADEGLIVVGATTGAAGTANIVDDGTIHFQGAARSSVAFAGGEGGALILDDASTFKGSIAGFDDDDMIQFKDLLVGSSVSFRYIESQNLLKVFENGVLDSKFEFFGSYTDADFQMIDDGTGHIAIQHVEPPII